MKTNNGECINFKNKIFEVLLVTLLILSILSVNVFAEYKILVSPPFSENGGQVLTSGSFGDTGYEGPGVKIKVPLYIQLESKGMYGGATIKEAGCGPTSASMVLAALTGKNVSVDEFAKKYSRFYVLGVGSSWELMTQFAKDNGLKVKQTNNVNEVKTALASGNALVISSQSPGIFTKGGHFIVLKGINGDTVYVNDPASRDRSKKGWNLQTQVHVTSRSYWIYTK